MGLLLGNEARYRTLERFFGIPREQANLATLVAARSSPMQSATRRESFSRPRGAPTLTDAVIGVCRARWARPGCWGIVCAGHPDVHDIGGVSVFSARSFVLRSTGPDGWRVGAVLHSIAATD